MLLDVETERKARDTKEQRTQHEQGGGSGMGNYGVFILCLRKRLSTLAKQIPHDLYTETQSPGIAILYARAYLSQVIYAIMVSLLL